MKILASTGNEHIARVYIAEFDPGELVEFVEALQTPKSRQVKWVLLISTLYGCPVECAMCDAGGFYHGKVPADKMLSQIDYMVRQRYPDGFIPCKQFKIQFSRMGEPTFNPAVLEVLKALPERYHAPGLMPSISTIAPHGREAFFEGLLEIKNQRYSGGQFQFQYSIHTTDWRLRSQIIPVKTWDFETMAAFGERFYQPGDRKITLNFALGKEMLVEPEVLLRHFDPAKFLIKITPLNPTHKALESGLASYIDPQRQPDDHQVVLALKNAGYQVIVSIGEIEENLVGSNCGQYVIKHLKQKQAIAGGYTYEIEPYNGISPNSP